MRGQKTEKNRNFKNFLKYFQNRLDTAQYVSNSVPTDFQPNRTSQTPIRGHGTFLESFGTFLEPFLKSEIEVE